MMAISMQLCYPNISYMLCLSVPRVPVFVRKQDVHNALTYIFFCMVIIVSRSRICLNHFFLVGHLLQPPIGTVFDVVERSPCTKCIFNMPDWPMDCIGVQTLNRNKIPVSIWVITGMAEVDITKHFQVQLL